MIEEVRLDRLEVPLSEPYRLSSVTVRSFDVALVRVRLADRAVGIGEVTSLEGYSAEGGDQAWENLRTVAETVPGTPPEEAIDWVESALGEFPFSATAFVSAIETAAGDEWPSVGAPVVGICSADDPPAARRDSLESQLDRGFETVKVKIGFEPEADAEALSELVAAAPEEVSFRADANQGYSPAETRRFLSAAPTDRLDHLEQPLPVGQLAAHARLTADSPVDIVLDEEVATAEDLAAAAAADAADGVKLKLMKCGGLRRARRLLTDAADRGFSVIFGNGVQSDIGCLLEAAVWSQLEVETVGEFNGWRKQTMSVLESPPEFSDGCLHWDGSRPTLDGPALDQYRLASAHFD
jgi:L-alanine-DL-glutamate epimerase-like enolase superfamily enzyme